MSNSYKILINGELRESISGKLMDVTNPADGSVIASVPSCDEMDVDAAAMAANAARSAWRNTYVGDRADMLLKLANLVKAHKEELVTLESAQYGGPISKTSRFDIPFAWKEFEYIAGLGRSLTGLTISGDPNAHIMTMREPLGTVGLITPWNFPLVTAVSKLAPALITGNTVVLKPSSVAPLTVLRLGEYIKEAGIPDGVVNIVTGPGSIVGEAIVTHRSIDKVNFTGDSAVGKRIYQLAADRIMPVASELGGKNAMLVLDDANISGAVQGAVHGAFFNSGQNCGSPSRFYVQEGIYDEFVSRFTKAAANIIVGDPMNPATMMGPLAYMACRTNAEGFIERAQQDGAKLLFGGDSLPPSLISGAYVMPTAFEVYCNKLEIMQEEIFAPVVGIMKISNGEEAIQYINDCRYGLCASVWTKDYHAGMKLIQGIDCGTTWLNQHLSIVSETPWGGRRESGWTKENSVLVLDEYTWHKHIWIHMNDDPDTFWKDMIA